jgi:hypothetical protein
MKKIIYTILFYLFFFNLKAQDLFFKPDTLIRYNNLGGRNDSLLLSQRIVYFYNSIGKVDSIQNFSYNTSTKTFNKGLTEKRFYDTQNRLLETTIGETFRSRNYYNKDGLDSLFTQESKTLQVWKLQSTIEKKYNSNKLLVAEITRSSTVAPLAKLSERLIDYDASGNLVQNSLFFFNESNGKINFQYRYVFTYDAAKVKSEIYDFKDFTMPDTSWVNQYKHDYVYTDSDAKVDQKINSKFNKTSNSYVVSDTFRFTYTTTFLIEERSDVRYTRKYETGGNEISYKAEFKKPNGMWIVENDRSLIYQNNKVVGMDFYFLNRNDSITTPFFRRREIYKYKLVSDIKNPRFDHDLAINVYPNPSSNIVFIDAGDLHIESMTLYNLQGQKVRVLDSSTSTAQINRGDLKSGMYYLLVETDQGSITKNITFTD